MRRLAAAAIACSLALPVAAEAKRPPQLSYGAAKRAIQSKADQFAQAKTRITAMFKLGAATYSGRAEWDRVNPTGCTSCGLDPVTGDLYDTPRTESCSLELKAKKLASGRVRVSTQNLLCY